ncbi:MAG: response regulator transcription factor [Leptolyngbyaceae cyanobacterium]
MAYFNELSDREHEVLELIVEGLSNTEIGQKLYLSPNTVKTYVKGIMNKLVVSDGPLGRSLTIASKRLLLLFVAAWSIKHLPQLPLGCFHRRALLDGCVILQHPERASEGFSHEFIS